MRRLMTVLGLALAVGCGGGGGGGGAEEAGGGEETGGGEAAATEGGPYAGPIGSTDLELGQAKFESRCGGCHDGSGDAPTVENIAWTPARMRQQIREGSGSMPAIPERRLSNDEMEAVLAYLVTIGGVTAQ